MNDKIEVLRRISNVIVGFSSYNTVFESVKYDNIVKEFDPSYSYDWKVNENDNIISLSNQTPIDCGGTIDRVSTLLYDIAIYYYIEDNKLTHVQIDVSDIKSNYKSDAVQLNDFINNTVQFLVTGVYSIFDGREYIALKEDEEKSRIELDANAKVSVGFGKKGNTQLSIRSLFINDLSTSYTFTSDKNMLDTIKGYSTVLGESFSSLMSKQNTEVSDIYKLTSVSEEVDVNAIASDFKDLVVDSGKSYLFNTILHKIKRFNRATLADLLTLYDGNGIELTDIKYIVNF